MKRYFYAGTVLLGAVLAFGLGRHPSAVDADFTVSAPDVAKVEDASPESSESLSSDPLIELEFRIPEPGPVQGIDGLDAGDAMVSYEVLDPFLDDFGPETAEQIVGTYEDPTVDSPSLGDPIILGNFTDPTVDSEDSTEARIIGVLEDPFAIDDGIEYEAQIVGEYAEP